MKKSSYYIDKNYFKVPLDLSNKKDDLSFFTSNFTSFSSYSSFFTSYGSFYTSMYSSYGSYYGSSNDLFFWSKEFMIKNILNFEEYLEFIHNYKIENNVNVKINNNQMFELYKESKIQQKSNSIKKDFSKGNLSYGFFSLGYGIELI